MENDILEIKFMLKRNPNLVNAINLVLIISI